MIKKWTLTDEEKRVIEDALATFDNISAEHYVENPNWFDRDLYEIFQDLLHGKTWED